MPKQYTKSFSNYILRSKPTASENGFIYENDLLTYGAPYNYVNGNLVSRTEGGFTFISNTEPTKKKEYSNGNFSDKITLNDILFESGINENVKSKDSLVVETAKAPTYITFDKTYTDLTKLAYFGSSNVLIQSAVEDIINRFPSSIYIDDYTILSGNGSNEITIPIALILNPFNINILDYTYDRPTIEYDLHILATSYLDYNIITNVNTNIASVTGFTNDGINIILNLSNIVNIDSSFHIMPSSKKQDEYFSTLDDFQKILLNRNTSPKYRSIFKLPEETQDGVTYNYREFIWETYDGHNLDISSMDYQIFIQELIDASIYIDENYSDNIYRMLVHDSLKSMDTCYERIQDDDKLDEYIAGGTKIQKLIRLYGREYDEIKKYAEGIGFSNKVSYDNVDNTPNLYLQSQTNSMGWDTTNLSNIISQTGKTSDNLFPSISGNLTTNEVAFSLAKRLILNSKNITKSKGTRKSIRKVFGLLGVDDSVYDIREYVQKTSNYITGETLSEIRTLNENLRSIEIENIYTSSIGKKDINIDYTGINIGAFIKSPTLGSQNYIISGDTGYAQCIEDGEIFEIAGNTYGYPNPRVNSSAYYNQQMGGWYRETGGIHTDLSGSTYVTDITLGNNPHISDGNYDYGFDYMDQFKQLFKADIRNEDNYPTFKLSDYNESGFSFLNKKEIDNNKISYNNLDNKLNINSKNFVIGINGDKAVELFYSGNTSAPSGLTREDVFVSIKSLVLPYIENIIPSTAIFDFILIDNYMPKWILVDKYCDRYNDINQNYNGKTILKYKNMNYFDEVSTGYTSDLTDKIIKDFGDFFEFMDYPTLNMVGFDREIRFIGDNGECDRDISASWEEQISLFNSSIITDDYGIPILTDSGEMIYTDTSNGITGDTSGGTCLLKRYSYYTYEQPTSCPCDEIISEITTYLPMGIYLKTYINTNENYSIDTSDESVAIVVSSIVNFANSYINDLVTTGYTSYDDSGFENRVIYDSGSDKYYYIDNTTNSSNCDLNTNPIFAIFNYETGDLFADTGDYFYNELDSCGIQTGNKYVYSIDINPSSDTYGQTDSILRCSQ